MPEVWDEEEDGIYEAPFVDNPEYKGAWREAKVTNPAYRGEWKPKQLANKDFVEDVYVHDDIGAVGFELWTVNKGSIFDNILITDSFDEAKVAGEKIKVFIEREKSTKRKSDKSDGKEAGATKVASASEDDDDDDDDDGSEVINMDKSEL